ncbi:beta-glucosidase [Ruminococcaceae bacterium KH2T8]|nr:beta-glucosidase [Ruminococcaceae bacterium KH2T8]
MDRASARQRATELVDKMTVEEMISQLRYDAPAIERLNIPEYNWWNEGLHGVARAGTATMFPQAIGLGATWDKELMYEVGNVISDEGRAKFNAFSKLEDRDIYKGLTYWSPNVNLFRDPRWGRGQETYGEDPVLISDLAIPFIKGLQGDGEHMKLAACAKHYAVHSGPEAVRHSFDAKATKKDLYETYLPQFEACVKEAKVESVMGAYNRVNGEPACAQNYLMNDVLRGDWGFEGHFVSDCWALRDFHENHKVTKCMEDSAALAINTGCDLNCGCTYLVLDKAVKQGKVSKETVRQAAIRLFTTRFLLGLFQETEYDNIPYDVIECKEHLALASKAAAESVVLLKNDGTLPIDQNKFKTIAVIGPNADSRKALEGNYHGTSSEHITVLEGIRKAMPDTRILYSEGSDIFEKKPDNLAREFNRISEAVAATQNSDMAILVLGLNENLEGEEGDTGNQFASGDKIDLQLPESQRVLMDNVLDAAEKKNIPVVVIVMTGSAMDLRVADERAAAILQAWYPGAQGGYEVAKILTGVVNPSAKLPVTVYRTTEELPDFKDYSMKGRTYRFIETEPLYPFGFGLSYSNIEIVSAQIESKDLAAAAKDGIKVTFEAKNTSAVDGAEIVQAYVKNDDENETLHPHLASFERINVPAGQTAKFEIIVPAKAFTTVNDEGVRAARGSSAEIFVGFGQPDKRTEALTGKSSKVFKI